MLDAHAELLARYDRVSPLVCKYQNSIPDGTGPNLLAAAGERLGLVYSGIFVLGAEAEMAVLADCSLYDVRINGLNAVQLYQRRHPPVVGSLDEVVLAAMAGARYAVLAVTDVVPGVGVQCHDLLRGQDFFLVNRGFSYSTVPGAVMASRVLSLAGLTMSTGADLPVAGETMMEILAALRDLGERRGIGREHVDDPVKGAEISLAIIRACLRSGAAEHIAYAPTRTFAEKGREAADRLISELEPAGPVVAPEGYSRNRPCPCGSGLKYKHCCAPPRTLCGLPRDGALAQVSHR